MDPQKTPSNSVPGDNPATNSADNANNEVTVDFGGAPTSPVVPNNQGSGNGSIPDASLSSDPATPISNAPNGGTAPFQPVQPAASTTADPFAPQPTITGETPPASPPTGSFSVSSPVPPSPSTPDMPPAQSPFGNPNPTANPAPSPANTPAPQPDLMPAMANTAHDKKTILILGIVAVVLIAAIAVLVFFK